MASAAVVLGLVAAAAPAPALAVLRKDVAEVVAAYEDLRYDEARKGAEALLAKGKNYPEDHGALLRVLGEIAAASGEKKDAARFLERLLAIDPAAAPAESASPKIFEAYEAARVRWKGYATFEVTHAPPKELEAGDFVLQFNVASDPLDLVKRIVVWYAAPGAKAWRTVDATGLDEIEVRVPAATLGAKAAAYFAMAVDEHGSAWRAWGSAAVPLVVPKDAFKPGGLATPVVVAGAAGAGGGVPLPPEGKPPKKGLSTLAIVTLTAGGVMLVTVITAIAIATRPTRWEATITATVRE